MSAALVEAVRLAANGLRAGLTRTADDSYEEVVNDALGDCRDALSRLEAALAAYDAAKGGDVLSDANVSEEDRCSTCNRPHAGHPETDACAVTAYRQVAERNAEDAAKYRAAVERANDAEATYRAVAAAYIGVSEYDDEVAADIKDHGVEAGLRSVAHGVARYFDITIDVGGGK